MKRTVLLLGLLSFILPQYRCLEFSANAEPKQQVKSKQQGHSVLKYKDVLIKNVPHVRQRPDFCGEACAEMFLRSIDKDMDQDYVFDQSGLSPTLARGLYTKELKTALENIGFKVGQVWYSISKDKADEELEELWGQLHSDLLRGIPSIVCMHYDSSPNTTEHFRLILGYDSGSDQIIYNEPAVDDGAYLRMNRSQFLKLWPLKYKTWTVVRLRLEEGNIGQGTASSTYTSADFAQHMMILKPKVPEGFTIVIEPPFVVIGDEDPDTVKKRSRGTVRWSASMLKQDFFSKDPDKILDVWLFKDKKSYVSNVQEIFNDTPTTPYGYYSERHGALIMNIATGGGTLVHEIVHPFMAANFENCPAWLNEGMGSLYEQCGTKDNHIYGYTNWRLPGLQEFIMDGDLSSFETLLSTTEVEFYDDDPGSNYAQARYLCYYLQEQGLLVEFYHKFYKNRDKDPTGLKTLKEVLKVKDLEEFQETWEQWILTLRFN